MATGTIPNSYVQEFTSAQMNTTYIDTSLTDYNIRIYVGLGMAYFTGWLKIKSNINAGTQIGLYFPTPADASGWIFLIGNNTGKIYSSRVLRDAPYANQHLTAEALIKTTDEYYHVLGFYKM